MSKSFRVRWADYCRHYGVTPDRIPGLAEESLLTIKDYGMYLPGQPDEACDELTQGDVDALKAYAFTLKLVPPCDPDTIELGPKGLTINGAFVTKFKSMENAASWIAASECEDVKIDAASDFSSGMLNEFVRHLEARGVNVISTSVAQ